MSNPARSERSALCDLLLEVGPDAPTLSGAWTTRDLAAHLIVRENRPDAAAGILLKAVARHGEKVRLAIAQQPFDQLVDKVRNGPPLWSPTRLPAIDRQANTIEFFVHHEDVRRGSGVVEPRSLDQDLSATLWALLSRMAKLLVRKAPAGLTLIDPAHGTIVAKPGEHSVTVTGPVGELVLYTYGRQAHSKVTVEGPAESVTAMANASFGI